MHHIEIMKSKRKQFLTNCSETPEEIKRPGNRRG
jgi:hypothetical protein